MNRRIEEWMKEAKELMEDPSDMIGGDTHLLKEELCCIARAILNEYENLEFISAEDEDAKDWAYATINCDW